MLPIDRDALTQGLIVQPAPFTYDSSILPCAHLTGSRCDIRPRDEGRAHIIRKSWEEAQSSLDNDGNFTEEFFEKVFPGK